jgi:hypothetical protein
MDYFDAVQEGRRRVNAAIEALQPLAGPCYPMLFLKLGVSDWTPVGTEILHKVIPGKNATAAIVVCDGEGNSKAMSAWLPEARAAELALVLASRGIAEFPGEVKLPV